MLYLCWWHKGPCSHLYSLSEAAGAMPAAEVSLADTGDAVSRCRILLWDRGSPQPLSQCPVCSSVRNLGVISECLPYVPTMQTRIEKPREAQTLQGACKPFDFAPGAEKPQVESLGARPASYRSTISV